MARATISIAEYLSSRFIERSSVELDDSAIAPKREDAALKELGKLY